MEVMEGTTLEEVEAEVMTVEAVDIGVGEVRGEAVVVAIVDEEEEEIVVDSTIEAVGFTMVHHAGEGVEVELLDQLSSQKANFQQFLPICLTPASNSSSSPSSPSPFVRTDLFAQDLEHSELREFSVPISLL